MPEVNLLLVPAAPAWRAPLPLDARPELRAAFERGQRDQDLWRDHSDEAIRQRLDELTSLPADERAAYHLGIGSTIPLRAPAPGWLAVPALAVTAVLELLALAPGRLRDRAFWIALSIEVGLLVGSLVESGERRRARALGLTVTTAPRPAPVGRLLAPLVLARAYNVWRWRRDGRWPRSDPSSAAAMTIVRELRRRRDWNAVRARTRPG